MIIEVDLTPYAFSDEVIKCLRDGMELVSRDSIHPTGHCLFKGDVLVRLVHGDTMVALRQASRLRTVRVKSTPNGNVLETVQVLAGGGA